MPYINQNSRQKYNLIVDELYAALDKNGIKPGDLNYCISRLLWSFFIKQSSYTLANSIIGMLECVKLEFYRRHVSFYENEKLEENGDIFDSSK